MIDKVSFSRVNAMTPPEHVVTFKRICRHTCTNYQLSHMAEKITHNLNHIVMHYY